jgi:23S rRNA-intervening sequence protein
MTYYENNSIAGNKNAGYAPNMPPTTSTTPIFSKTFDLLAWLIPLTLKFPRQQRFVIAKALQSTAFDLQTRLLEAARVTDPQGRLLRADIALASLRTQLRLAHHWQLMTDAQYEHAARLQDEVGRLLGAWIKTAKANAANAARQP